MRILNVLGFFGIFWFNSNQCNASSVMQTYLEARECKDVESTVMRLKDHLFCDYDLSVQPNYPKATNVTMQLMPQLITFTEHNSKLSLDCWISFFWSDPQLSWTSSDYDEITFIHVNSWEIWTPTLFIVNSADMSSDQYYFPPRDCFLYKDNSILCVFATKFISKCAPDYTYWPYDKHHCRITFMSWVNINEEVHLQIDEDGIGMSEYQNNSRWDFKFINSTNDTLSSITYNFLLTRHHGIYHSSFIVPAIALILLTIIVLCLDVKSTERMAVANVNFICHLLCMYMIQWTVQYNGVNPPNIFIFYRESLALATYTVILTVLLRKLEDMSIMIPNWVLSITTFTLSNKVGRFLILKDDESKITGKDIATEESSDIPKAEVSIKESSWKYFAAIIDWLSLFCVILTYLIVLIILIPMS
ncbi:hypothetical protein P5V15_013656 [Pogonomyrmex californicus]